jgi:large subunit ribosomal protein L25
MERFVMTAETRNIGKGASRKLRAEGKVPAVLYGKSVEPKSLAVDSHEFEKISKKAHGSIMIFDLNVAGETTTALVRDYQADPFRREVTHIDFQAVGLNDKIEVEIPVQLTGSPAGVKEGGILEQLRRTLNVRCLVSKIPSHFDVDVSALNIGDNIHADELALPEGVEFPQQANFTIAAVVPPTKEEEVKPAVVAEGEEGAEVPAEGEEKPAEGEAAAGGEKKAAGGEEKKEKK